MNRKQVISILISCKIVKITMLIMQSYQTADTGSVFMQDHLAKSKTP